jgi:alkylation response protein AidB-like acyl-CoA dehydrogenase
MVIRTRAVCVERDWKITETKQFITLGRIGGLAMIVAVTDPDICAVAGHIQIGLLLLRQ